METKKKPVAVVIIPTYNEAKVIAKMISYLFEKIFPTIKNWQMKLLIVDDTSPDGTYKVVRAWQKKYPDLYLYLNSRKMGLGYAYVQGFRYAMEKLAAAVVIEFDADFQHPPETIPLLLKEIEAGYDYVLGSRKIPGGSVPKHWGFKRKLFTFLGGFVARFILFFPFKAFWQITDPTTGLKASRVKGFVDRLDMDHLYSYKFAYKLEFLYKMVQLGAKIKEIPLKFQLRRAGKSKISPDTAKDIFRTIILLRWHDKTTQKFLKFALVGFLGYLVNASTLWYFGRLGWPEWTIWFSSTELAIISNFTWNNLWTFREEKFTKLTKVLAKFIQFNLTSAGALIIQTVAGTGLTFLLGSQYRQLILPVVIVFLVLPYNWLMYNRIIWRQSRKKSTS